jgi:hypothetical protein
MNESEMHNNATRITKEAQDINNLPETKRIERIRTLLAKDFWYQLIVTILGTEVKDLRASLTVLDADWWKDETGEDK